MSSGSFVVYQSFPFQFVLMFENEERFGAIMSHMVGFCIGYQ